MLLHHRRSPSPNQRSTGTVQSPHESYPLPANTPCPQRASSMYSMPTPGMVEMLTIQTGPEYTEPLLAFPAEPDKETACCCFPSDNKGSGGGYTCIFWCNFLAVFIHFLMLCVSWGVAGERSPKLYNLKMDRVQVVPIPTNQSNLTSLLPEVRKRFLNESGGIYFVDADVRDLQTSLNRYATNELNSSNLALKARCNEEIERLYNSIPSIANVSHTEFQNTARLLHSYIESQANTTLNYLINNTNSRARHMVDDINVKSIQAYETTVNTDFLQMRSPYTAGWPELFNKSKSQYQTLSQTCGLAEPNALRFQGGLIENVDLEMWVYPKAAHTQLNLGWMVACFFTLSFFMQLPFFALSCDCVKTTWLRVFSYQYIFGNAVDDYPLSNETADEEKKRIYKNKNPLFYNFERICEDETRFNWLRFVEYSGSGSLVLIVVALTAGIFDIELLGCMFAMSAVCMLLGLVAEVIWRVRNVLLFVRNFVVVNPKRNNQQDYSQSMLYSTCPLSKAKAGVDKILNGDPDIQPAEDAPVMPTDHILIHTLETLKTKDENRNNVIQELRAQIDRLNLEHVNGNVKQNMLGKIELIIDLSNSGGRGLLNLASIFSKDANTHFRILNDRATDKLTRKIVVKWMTTLSDSLLGAFWLTHLLAWVCIAIPWIIILQHFWSWWHPCQAMSLDVSLVLETVKDRMTSFYNETNLDASYGGRRSPPDFVYVSITPTKTSSFALAINNVDDWLLFFAVGRMGGAHPLPGLWPRASHAAYLVTCRGTQGFEQGILQTVAGLQKYPEQKLRICLHLPQHVCKAVPRGPAAGQCHNMNKD